METGGQAGDDEIDSRVLLRREWGWAGQGGFVDFGECDKGRIATHHEDAKSSDKPLNEGSVISLCHSLIFPNWNRRKQLRDDWRWNLPKGAREK